MLKRNPSLTEQAKTHIKQRIINDEFEEGRIPAETELANELGVSRTTIRDALSRLELEGAIFRRQGAGTFVNEVGLQIKTRLEEIWTYEKMLQDHGYTPTIEVLQIEEVYATETTANDLRVTEGETLLVVKKLFTVDGRPVILTINHIPKKIVQQTYTSQDFQPAIYNFLQLFCQQQLTYYLSEVVPLSASAELSQLLQVPPKKALISFEEIGYNQDNQPILKAYSYFRDDMLRLRLLRRET